MKNIAFVVATGLTAAIACATPLLPGSNVQPLTTYANTVNSATQVGGFLFSNFTSPGGLYSGHLTSAVFINMPDNPYGAGFLSFAYQLVNDSTSSHSLGRFTITGYTGFNTDVGNDPFYATGTNVAGFEATRQADGSSIGFTFLAAPVGGGLVTPGVNSYVFVVHTNATLFTISPASVIDGDIANAEAYSPLPTPGAGALLALGAVASLRRRR
jgi:MYXO-CTERM domain-containing protein